MDLQPRICNISFPSIRAIPRRRQGRGTSAAARPHRGRERTAPPHRHPPPSQTDSSPTCLPWCCTIPDCTGSMAFVHYLCVEQWRCRSRHPRARDGLNCETCGAEYALPPQPSRRNLMWEMRGPGTGGLGGNLMVKDDCLDSMPLHVLAALQRPHPAWQLGQTS